MFLQFKQTYSFFSQSIRDVVVMLQIVFRRRKMKKKKDLTNNINMNVERYWGLETQQTSSVYF